MRHHSQERGQPRAGGRTGCLGTEVKGSRVKESKEGLSVGQRKRNPSPILYTGNNQRIREQ